MSYMDICGACGKTITPTIDGLKNDPLGADYVCYNCHQQIKVEIMTIIREWDERNGLETSVCMEGELTDSLINKFYEIQLLRKKRVSNA